MRWISEIKTPLTVFLLYALFFYIAFKSLPAFAFEVGQPASYRINCSESPVAEEPEYYEGFYIHGLDANASGSMYYCGSSWSLNCLDDSEEGFMLVPTGMYECEQVDDYPECLYDTPYYMDVLEGVNGSPWGIVHGGIAPEGTGSGSYRWVFELGLSVPQQAVPQENAVGQSVGYGNNMSCFGEVYEPIICESGYADLGSGVCTPFCTGEDCEDGEYECFIPAPPLPNAKTWGEVREKFQYEEFNIFQRVFKAVYDARPIRDYEFFTFVVLECLAEDVLTAPCKFLPEGGIVISITDDMQQFLRIILLFTYSMFFIHILIRW